MRPVLAQVPRVVGEGGGSRDSAGLPEGRPDAERAFTLSAEDEAAIREAAAHALEHAFRRLRQQRVIPRPAHRPWIQMARDYFGESVEGSEGRLSKALEAAVPARFTPVASAIDHPWSYARATLEAAVAAATRADEPYSVSSPSVAAAIDELIATIRRQPSSRTVIVVADLDVVHDDVPEGHRDRLGESLAVGGTRIVRVGSEPERFIELELPSAGYEVDRGDVFVYPEPTSLIVCSSDISASYEARQGQARASAWRLLTSIRLATAATAYALASVEGDVGCVRWIHPAITPIRAWGYRFAHRSAVLGPEEATAITGLMPVVEEIETDDAWVGVRIALNRLNRSLAGQSPGVVDQVVDLAVGLEAALSGVDKTEIGLRLRSRAGALLATDEDSAESIYRDVKVLYELRSTYVHGSSLDQKSLNRMLAKVSAHRQAEWPAEQYLLVLDRWRDILRRAILARIALAEAEDGWPRSSRRAGLDIDEVVLKPPAVERWRTEVHDYWIARGLERAPNQAPPAALSLGSVRRGSA